MTSRRLQGTITGTHQGVSQQPEHRRSADQANVLENVRCNIAEGTTNRPGSQHITTITVPVGTPYVGKVEYGLDDSPHILTLTGSSCLMTDTDNVTHTVDISAIGTYLNSTDPEADFHTHKFGNHLLVLNKTVTAEMTADTVPAVTNNLLIYAPQTAYGRDYELLIDDVSIGT